MSNKVKKETITKLNLLQHRIFDEKKSVLIMFEGAGGKHMSFIVNGFISLLEPRGVSYSHAAFDNLVDYYFVLPPKGRIGILDKTWYTAILDSPKKELLRDVESTRTCEKYLADNGMLIIKIYLDMREKTVAKNKDSYPIPLNVDGGYLEDSDIDYSKYSSKTAIELIRMTNFQFAEWNIVEVGDYFDTISEIAKTVIDKLDHLFKHPYVPAVVQIHEIYPNPREEIDLSKTIDKADYKKKLAKYQLKLSELQCKLAKSDKALVLAFEGWDAAGKGGAIKRVTQALNPRGYTVVPVPAPTAEEKSHTHLWRFGIKTPHIGHTVIFDRSWYGRMMVEPIEGFCTEEEYSRAATEINYFEEKYAKYGAIIIKFWIEVSKEEQLRRFNERKENPLKQWKITEEDWRNRDKWDTYEKYVNSMMKQTNTPYAPWVVIENEDKNYGRIKVLKTICDILEKELE